MAKTHSKSATLLLPSVDGSELELTVTGFRWSAERGIRDFEDYLRTHVRVLAPYGSIEFHFSGILNWEAEDLANWLLTIAKQQPGTNKIYFNEGYLYFVLQSQADRYITIRALIADYIQGWHFAPDLDTSELQGDWNWPFVDLEMSHNQLMNAATSFQQSLHRLPTRTS
jgi:hypothetical protein